MKAPNTGGQTAPYTAYETRVEIAVDGSGDARPLASVDEYGQWTAARAGEAEELLSHVGTAYDPLLHGWTNAPLFLHADNVLLEVTSYAGTAPSRMTKDPPADGAYYGWRTLYGGQGLFVRRVDATPEDEAEEATLVAGRDVGQFKPVSCPSDLGLLALRQASPAALWGMISEVEHPLPPDPSFALKFRLDDLQAEGNRAVADPSAAWAGIEFGAGAWRVTIRPGRQKREKNAHTQWVMYLEERTDLGWMVRLGPEDGLDTIKVDSDGLAHIVVQCIDERIVVRPDLLSEDGAIYTRYNPVTMESMPVHVASGPVVVYGSYVTGRIVFSRVIYAGTGWLCFPPMRGYVSASTQHIRARVTGTGWACEEKDANATAFTFAAMDPLERANAWRTIGQAGSPWNQFERRKCLQVVVAQKSVLNTTAAVEAPTGPWFGYEAAPADAWLVCLRMQPARDRTTAPGWYGSHALPEAERTFAFGSGSLVVRTLKVCWPVVVSVTAGTWEALPTSEWASWSVRSSLGGDTVGRTEGTLMLGDTGLPGARTEQTVLHGRRWYRVSGWWWSEFGDPTDTDDAWTGGVRHVLLGKGPRRDGAMVGIQWGDLLTLAEDARGLALPPCDAELTSQVIADTLLRCGIPAAWHTVWSSGQRVPLTSAARPEPVVDWRERKDALDALGEIAKRDGAAIYCEAGAVVYADTIGSVTVAQAARAWEYSDGYADLVHCWPVVRASLDEPTADEREVSHVVVTGLTECGPVSAEATVTDPDREGDQTVVGGIGRRRDRTEGGKQITSLGQAQWLAYSYGHIAEVDVGDLLVVGAADPELRLLDVGTVHVRACDLWDDRTAEVVGVEETLDRRNGWRMTVHGRATART